MKDQPRALTDMFRCEPYNAKITASACIKRQELAADSGKDSGVNVGWGRNGSGSKGAKADVVLCIGCTIGADVLRGLEGKPPAAEPIPAGRLQRCTSCGVQGHNARSCPERDIKPANVTTPNQRLAAVAHPAPTIDPLPPKHVLVHPELLPESDEIDRLIHARATAIEKLSTERAALRARLERVEEQLRQLSAFTAPAT